MCILELKDKGDEIAIRLIFKMVKRKIRYNGWAL